MSMVRMLHLIGACLAFGGLICQLVLLGRYHHSKQIMERAASERMAKVLIALVQVPGVYLSLLSGVALAWGGGWEPFSQGWLQFKLLFFFWILLATRLMARNARSILSLREQCGETDSERLRSLKSNHRMIGYVTVVAFIFVLVLSIWKPF